MNLTQPIITLSKDQKKELKTKKKYQYDNILFDSKEEIYFYWWASELKKKGMLHMFDTHPSRPYVLFEKTKTLRDCSYSPDFIVYWNGECDISINYESDDKTYLKSQEDISNIFSMIDIKPSHERTESRKAVFSLKRKWMFQRFELFVNEVVIYPVFKTNKKTKIRSWSPKKTLFTETFVPDRFFLTDGATRERKINFEFKTFDEFYLN